MRLVCKKYRWLDVSLSGDNDANFFSNASKELISTIDLKYYLIKDTLSEFEKTYEGINDVNKGLEIRMSNLSFQCKNEMLDRYSLQEFFEMYKENSRIKFTLEYYDDNDEKLFSGIIYKNNVSFSNRVDDILDIIAVSEEKEFIDYFSQKDISYPSAFYQYTFNQMFGTNNITVSNSHIRFYSLLRLLEANLTNVTIGEIPANYFISKIPFTYFPFTADKPFAEMGSLYHIRAGLDQFINDQIKVYDFFSSLFLSKGWIWYFDLGKLYVKPRGETNLTSTNIDYRTEVLSHSISSDLLEEQVDNVTVFNGSYFDNDSTNGALHFTSSDGVRRYLGAEVREVYTTEEHSNKIRPFVTLTHPSNNNYLIDIRYLDYSFYNADTDRDLIRHRLRLNGPAPYDANEVTKSYSRQRTLTIEPVIVSQDNAAGFDLNNARAMTGEYTELKYGNLYYSDPAHTTDSMIFYRANPGSCMIRFDTVLQKYFTYEVDCQKEPFQNNFKKYVRSANPILFDIEVKKKITNAFQNITISNYPYENSISSKTFIIHKLSYNDITKISKLTIQMI